MDNLQSYISNEIMDNVKKYIFTLNKLVHDNMCDIQDIHGEIVSYVQDFYPEYFLSSDIDYSDKYAAQEIDWYQSQDLCIKNHVGICDNTIWNSCATKDGFVNSNYGWCVFSKENFSQYEFVLEELLNNKSSRKAIMVYTRPSIVVECRDGVHANNDMLCTQYVSYLIRDDKLIANVHMRSNDIWYGFKYDFNWQVFLYNKLYNALKQKYLNLTTGLITWHADSLHLYKRNVSAATKLLQRYK